MNCYNHSDREAVGMCVSCGNPICLECKVIFKDKLYCNPCIEGNAKFIYESGSWAWWFLPTLFGIIGGAIAMLLTQRKNPRRATDYLIVGTIVTFCYFILSAFTMS